MRRKVLIIIIIDNFCIALFSGVHKLTALKLRPFNSLRPKNVGSFQNCLQNHVLKNVTHFAKRAPKQKHNEHTQNRTRKCPKASPSSSTVKERERGERKKNEGAGERWIYMDVCQYSGPA